MELLLVASVCAYLGSQVGLPTLTPDHAAALQHMFSVQMRVPVAVPDTMTCAPVTPVGWTLLPPLEVTVKEKPEEVTEIPAGTWKVLETANDAIDFGKEFGGDWKLVGSKDIPLPRPRPNKVGGIGSDFVASPPIEEKGRTIYSEPIGPPTKFEHVLGGPCRDTEARDSEVSVTERYTHVMHNPDLYTFTEVRAMKECWEHYTFITCPKEEQQRDDNCQGKTLHIPLRWRMDTHFRPEVEPVTEVSIPATATPTVGVLPPDPNSWWDEYHRGTPFVKFPYVDDPMDYNKDQRD